MRFRNIEFRWSETNNTYELIQWYKGFQIKATGTYEQKETCCVVAFFDKGKEGYDMRTVGDRFFEDKDAWVVGKSAMSFLQDTFEIEKQEEELK
jgi:hypothetical protein